MLERCKARQLIVVIVILINMTIAVNNLFRFNSA